jgi:hypothetical protein
MPKAVFCIANNEAQAISIIERLKVAGYSNNDISVLFPDKSGTRDFIHEHHTKAPEGAISGAGAGGLAGGALGWLAGLGTLAIPGLGPFIVAGPLMAALSGAAVGATIGGVAGTLIGLGIPEFEAKRYEGKVKAGNLLLSVHAKTTEQEKEAKDIFQTFHAQDISIGGEVGGKRNRPQKRRDI